MIKIKFCASLLILLIHDAYSDTSCTLPNSKTLTTCVDTQKCSSWQLSTDFLFSDRVEELLERVEACKHVGPKKICCELEHPSTIEPKVEIPNSQEISPEKHKNFKMFNNVKCGDPKPLDRVANGENAGLLQHPWIVRIKYTSRRDETFFGCGGTLISPLYVLTAAHCIINLPSTSKPFSVRLGEYDEKTNPDCGEEDDPDSCADPIQDITIESFKAHPKYDPVGKFHDIGIIRLSKPARLSQDNIATICLPFDQSAKRISKTLEVIGWGRTTNTSGFPILQKASLPEVDQKLCQDKLRAITKNQNLQIIDTQICAGGENKIDACKGDSGGPLQAPTTFYKKPRMVQYGIVSFGVFSCGVESVPGIYTRVSKYLNWIMDNMH